MVVEIKVEATKAPPTAVDPQETRVEGRNVVRVDAVHLAGVTIVIAIVMYLWSERRTMKTKNIMYLGVRRKIKTIIEHLGIRKLTKNTVYLGVRREIKTVSEHPGKRTKKIMYLSVLRKIIEHLGIRKLTKKTMYLGIWRKMKTISEQLGIRKRTKKTMYLGIRRKTKTITI